MNEQRKHSAESFDANRNNNVNTNNTAAIRNALSNVLSNDKFMASPQMSAFLSYVVEETVAGNADRIKAYTVAVDALGKPTSFDPQNDPSVRVLANRLRASLNNYYANNPEQALFIELYRGSYVPHFIDSLGREHIQKTSKNMPQAANALLVEPLEKIENLFAPSSRIQGANDLRRERQRSDDSVNRVNSWLLGSGNKYS